VSQTNESQINEGNHRSRDASYGTILPINSVTEGKKKWQPSKKTQETKRERAEPQIKLKKTEIERTKAGLLWVKNESSAQKCPFRIDCAFLSGFEEVNMRSLRLDLCFGLDSIRFDSKPVARFSTLLHISSEATRQEKHVCAFHFGFLNLSRMRQTVLRNHFSLPILRITSPFIAQTRIVGSIQMATSGYAALRFRLAFCSSFLFACSLL